MRNYINLINEFQQFSDENLPEKNEPKVVNLSTQWKNARDIEHVLQREFKHTVTYSRKGTLTVKFEIVCHDEQTADDVRERLSSYIDA